MSVSFVLFLPSNDFMWPPRGPALSSKMLLIGQALLQRSQLIKMPAGFCLSISAKMSGKPLIQGTFPLVFFCYFQRKLEIKAGNSGQFTNALILIIYKLHFYLFRTKYVWCLSVQNSQSECQDFMSVFLASCQAVLNGFYGQVQMIF